jgi:UDP-N-acetyl-D-glucosamine/UDP-N-acetyl-D-galactosamine dehydrogenase
MLKSKTIAVLGLGYVGLPLVIAFGKKITTIGFDISSHKVDTCIKGKDPSKELSAEQMQSAKFASYTKDPAKIAIADFILVAVSTPVYKTKIPDLSHLVEASIIVGRNMKKGAIIIFESTVYPGATEELCIPLLERESGFKWKKDFFVGYSPERINPGDKQHTLTKVIKIVSGDSPNTLERVAELYELIVKAGVHRVNTIKVAESAKIIENIQRDLNIALMNELAIIFNKLDINTNEVLEAAETKWNFLKFKPGLVGGHCIGVDPYYLTYKAEMSGYHPQIILAGRRINDGMGKYIAEMTIKKMINNNQKIKGSVVNVLGLTFKENCADLRNSKVIDIINELKIYGIEVAVTDPYADIKNAQQEYGINLLKWNDLPKADAIVAAVAHKEYRALKTSDIAKKLVDKGVFVDVKSNFNLGALEAINYLVWRM